MASSNVQERQNFAVLVKMALHHRKRDNKSLVKATKTIIYIDHRKQSTTNVSADSQVACMVSCSPTSTEKQG